MWNGAAKAGLALAGLSSVYLFATQFIGTTEIPAILNMLLTTVLWIVKFGGCIWLMMFFMKKFADECSGVDNAATRRFGIIAAFLSAVVYAGVSFANVAFISADLFAEQMDAVIQQMAPMMDSNTMEQMDDMLGIMPQLTFFSNLIYCFFYGTILSFILSRNIPDRNPFAERSSDEW